MNWSNNTIQLLYYIYISDSAVSTHINESVNFKRLVNDTRSVTRSLILIPSFVLFVFRDEPTRRKRKERDTYR